MSRVNFSSVILDLQGKPCKDGLPPERGEPDQRLDLTLAMIAGSALTSPLNEEGPTAAVKLERFRVAIKVAGGGDVDLKAEEIATIKDVIGRAYPPLVVGRAYELLDPPPTPKKPKEVA